MERPDWPHQVRAVHEVIQRVENGHRSMCLTSPTGSGKSVMIQRLCEHFVSEGKLVSVMTNRRLLTNQLAKGLSDSGVHIGVRAAQFESWTDMNAPVQICSFQTENARVFRRRERAIQNLATEEEAMRDHSLFPANVVIVDEAHMSGGENTVRILDELSDRHGAVRIGVTATPLGISRVYDELIVAANNSELRALGALVPAVCKEPMVVDMSKVYRSKHELPSQQEMEKQIRHIWTQHIVGGVHSTWREHNPDGRPTIGFAPGVKESLGLAMEFQRRGVPSAHIGSDSVYIDGTEYRTNNQEVRDEIFGRSKDGTIKCIFNRFVLREAIDLPWIGYLSLACPIASLLSYIQTVGRGLRASAGKSDCVIADHCGNIRLHGSPNMDRDAQWIAYYHEDENKITRDRVNDLRSAEPEEPEPITCPECKTMRRSGPKCPSCGFQHVASIRYIMQESGKLVPSRETLFPKRRIKMEPNTAQIWEKCYHRCRNAKRPMTFSQARALFIHENHYTPPDGLPFMPKNRLDWTRKIKAVSINDLVPRNLG